MKEGGIRQRERTSGDGEKSDKRRGISARAAQPRRHELGSVRRAPAWARQCLQPERGPLRPLRDAARRGSVRAGLKRLNQPKRFLRRQRPERQTRELVRGKHLAE